MKKIIALISSIAVLGSFSVTALAEYDIKAAEGFSNTITESSDVFTTNVESITGTNAQTTIVAVKGDGSINTSSIQYINQDAAANFSFALKDELKANETIHVFVGGDKINKTEIGTIALEAAPAGYKISGSLAEGTYPTDEFFDPEGDFAVAFDDAFEEEVFADENEKNLAMETAKAEYEVSVKLYKSTDLEDYVNATLNEEGVEPEKLQEVKVLGDGTFSFENVANGGYFIAIDKDGVVPYVNFVTVDGEDVSMEEISLVLGEYGGDAESSILDALTVFNSGSKDLAYDEGFVVGYDVNFDIANSVLDALKIFNRGSFSIFDYDNEATSLIEEEEWF